MSNRVNIARERGYVSSPNIDDTLCCPLIGLACSEEQENILFEGQTIGNVLEVAQPEECKEACKKTMGCKGWVWSEKQFCKLLKEIDQETVQYEHFMSGNCTRRKYPFFYDIFI